MPYKHREPKEAFSWESLVGYVVLGLFLVAIGFAFWYVSTFNGR